MTHKYRNKQLQRIKKKYKNLAAIVAAATILSTTMLPGMPTATAHASASSATDNLSASTSQGIGKTDQSSSQINFNSSRTPATKSQKESTASKPTSAPASETPTAKTPAPESRAPETPAPKTPTPKTPTPKTPAPETPAPKTPAPETPAPETPAPETPAPETPAPETPAPETPAPETPAPETPAPETPAPETPAPVTPAPETPAPKPPAHTENKPSSNTAPTNYKQVLDISATAYAPGPHDNDQWGNKTYIGSQVRPGIIAVDPKVIPLGSRVYIEYPDGHGEYAIAEDTGGAIKGNRVDIAKWTVNEAKDFGIQKVKVYVVNTPEKV